VDYAKWLSEQTGNRYRLPTEAEWEYAARAGTQTRRYWGDDPDSACKYANVYDRTAKQKLNFDWSHHDCDNGYVVTSPVGRFEPNRFKLYDMLGNVWEWTCSAYDEGYGGAEQRCQDEGDVRRSLRGGAWDDIPRYVRSADRNGNEPSERDGDIGFRVAQDL
jgi:formylglycine-generating enzyme required for sulfatase activity